MGKLQGLVKDLNNQRGKQDEADKVLYSMMEELKNITSHVGMEILGFLGDYRKYFGKVFIFEGTVRPILY